MIIPLKIIARSEGIGESFLIIWIIPIIIISKINARLIYPRVIRREESEIGGKKENKRSARGYLKISIEPKGVAVILNQSPRMIPGSEISIIVNGKKRPIKAIIPKIMVPIPRKRVYLVIVVIFL